ncbi:hypothetical protein MP638_006413 [Amoeboaphelidium occidentale]|nr:hypothetical protein MP638_006413 [Amoeboaphelidium occidentale]
MNYLSIISSLLMVSSTGAFPMEYVVGDIETDCTPTPIADQFISFPAISANQNALPATTPAGNLAAPTVSTSTSTSVATFSMATPIIGPIRTEDFGSATMQTRTTIIIPAASLPIIPPVATRDTGVVQTPANTMPASPVSTTIPTPTAVSNQMPPAQNQASGIIPPVVVGIPTATIIQLGSYPTSTVSLYSEHEKKKKKKHMKKKKHRHNGYLQVGSGANIPGVPSYISNNQKGHSRLNLTISF